MFILKVEHIEKTYSINGDMVKAVNDISFSIEQGEFVAITGSSGSGKSTLLHIIGGVDSASAGTVDIKGVRMQDLKGDELAIFRRKNISIIYQFYNLIPVLNVKENITLPLKLDHQIIDEERLSFFLNILNLEMCIRDRYGCACHRTADCTQNRLHQADHRSVPYSLCYRRQGYVWKNGWSHGYENGIDRKKKSRYAEIILRGIIKKKARVETCLINLRHL